MGVISAFFASLEEALGAEETNIGRGNVSGWGTKGDVVTFGVTNGPIYKTNASDRNGRSTDAMNGGIVEFAVGVRFKIVDIVRR